MRRKLFLILLSVFLLFSACGVGGGTDTAGTDEKQSYNLVFVCPIIENEYWQACIKGIEAADAEFGTNTQVIGPRTADNFAVEIIDYMCAAIDSEPDGIMLYAGIEGLHPLIDEAVEKGIHVLTIDADAPDTLREAYIGTNLYNFGYQAGVSLVNLTGGSAKVGYVCSTFSAQSEVTVFEAFRDAIADYDIEIVSCKEGQADPDVASGVVADMLDENPEITAIFCTAGYNITGAGRVKEARGLDDLMLVGFDDVEENLAFVRKGIIDALLVQSPEQMGYQGVRLMRDCINSGELQNESYDTGSILVTQDNVDSYSSTELASGGSGKTVRVGYYTGDSSFQDGFGDDERKTGYAYEYYQAIALLTGWRYEYVYCTRSEAMDMLRAGEIDITAGIYETDKRLEQVLLSKYDMGLGSPQYFAVAPDRDDLYSELNYALERIQAEKPNFAVELRQEYYGQDTAQQILTAGEKQWLAEKGCLNIGYVRYNMPLSDQDADGNPTGVVKELMEILSDYLHIKLNPVCYENVTQMEDALRDGRIDIAFPMYSDLWTTENKGLLQTDSFISDRVMVVYQGSYSGSLMDNVFLSQTGLGQRQYLSIYYPNASITLFDTRAEAFEAIKRDSENSCMLGCSSVLQRFLLTHPEYDNFNIAYLDTSEEFGMAVNGGESILAGILNKAIRQMDSAIITSAMISYSGVEMRFSFMDVVQKYSIGIISILIVLLVLFAWIFAAFRQKTRRFNAAQAKAQAQLEEALRAAKVASEAKTTFLASMSHDIRTPMNAIIGITAIASKHLDEREKIEDCLDKISLSSHHLLTLINDVLDISKIESGKLALNPVNFSLRDTVTSLVNIIRPQMKEKDLQFDVHIHGIAHEIVYADEVRINQIFINILTNAVKYTPNGGKVIMDLSETILPEGDKVQLVYKVEDTGIGMSEDYMKIMYETFTRVEDSRVNKIQGTGLGLAIVKQMVDLMGGTIECKSEENAGTIFTVTLEVPPGDASGEKPMLPDIRILLIDDDGIFLETAMDTLADMGAHPEAVNNGADAVRLVKARHKAGEDYQVVIVDWKMPGMDGLQTVQAIRNVVGRDVPIILVSAYEWTEIEDEARESGADSFISKPLFRSYVYEKVCEVLHLGSRQAADETAGNEDLRGRHLLVAEDNDLNWEVVSELLGMYGITADHAENGQICVDMLRAAPADKYDMILMDIQMPVMNGREATTVIRADSTPYIRDIPIVAMTADAFAEDIAACRAVGMDGHVPKPVDMDTLCQEMRKILGRKSEKECRSVK